MNAIQRLTCPVLLGGLLLAPGLILHGGAPAALPPYAEVAGVIRSNLVGITPDELNRAAVQGLLEQLAPRAALLPENPPPVPATNLIAAAELYNEHFAYLRVGQFAPGLAEEFAHQLTEMTKGKDREGLVLDLRFAAGWDYAEAARIADFFLDRKVPLINWGAGMQQSTPGGRVFQKPVIVLINARTSGAASALAGIFRQTRVALLIGGSTAGDTFAFREFPLTDGSLLRLAQGRVRLGDGVELPPEGIAPDLAVPVPVDEQEAYVKNPRAVLANATNPATRAPNGNGNARRLTEAELVRLHSRGLTNPASSTLPSDSPNPHAGASADTQPDDTTENSPAAITDPMLARALDLLKGLAIVRAATGR